MQYVNFGTTGLQISRLGFGGIPIQRIDQPGTRELLIAAHKAGINYIDTARAYTVSEAWIGQSLEEAGLRDDFILATKCRALTKADMEAEIATSLKNLRTDHIELSQFHNPEPRRPEHHSGARRRNGGAARGKGQGHRRAYRHHGAPGRCV